MSSLNANPVGLCDQAPKILNQSTGWQFAKILQLYYGDISITLSGEGADGCDLTFAVSSLWLKLNNPFPVRDREAYDRFESMRMHAVKCAHENCREAICRIHVIIPYIRPENRKIPGGDALAMISQLVPYGASIITSKKDAPSLVEEFKPILLWFNEPDLWTPVPEK